LKASKTENRFEIGFQHLKTQFAKGTGINIPSDYP